MKKLMCLALGVSLIGAMVVVAGCGGGGGLGTILGAAFVIAIIASTGGAGGAGAVPFAASLRERPAIRGAVNPISAGSLQFKVTPLAANGAEGTPQYFDATTTSTITEVVGTASMNVSGSEYKVELVRKADGVALLKNVLVADDLDTNPSVSTTVNASTTASVLVYTEWLKSNAIDGSFTNFQAGIGNVIASIASIGQDIENDFAADGSATLSDYTADALSTANQVSNVFNNQSIKGWWLLDPNLNNEYAAFYNYPNANSTSTGIITNTSDFFFHDGFYSIQPNGSLFMDLLSMEGQQQVLIHAMATMTSTSAATYEAYQGNTLEESGTALKVSNPAACAGTWNGTADGDAFTVVIDSNGFIQSIAGTEQDALPAYVAETNGVKNGFVVSEGGKVAGFIRFNDDVGTRVRFFGTLSGTTFNGTIEAESVLPEEDLPNGTITMTKQ